MPAEHWGAPLYLAGLGAIADLADVAGMEIRAGVRVPTDHQLQRERFANHYVVPLGIQMLAEALEEDADRPDALIRTRALLTSPSAPRRFAPRTSRRLCAAPTAPSYQC